VSNAPPPTLDVVITNHDHGRFLGAAIDSALGQTLSPGRVVVVDDGSSDDSRSVIARYGDRIVPVLKANGGQASAANAGFALTRGDVVLFLDSDDVLEPFAAERITAVFRDRPDLARVHFHLAVIDAAGNPTGQVNPPAHLCLPSGDTRAATLRTPFDQPWAAMSGNAFSAAVLRQLLPAPEGQRVGADWYLVHVSSLYGPVAAIDAPLARYRVHDRNGYARGRGDLDVGQLRATVAFAATTREQIAAHAHRLGLPGDARRMWSMSDVGNRLILLRLGGGGGGGDRRLGLLHAAIRAARGRRDVGWPLRMAFVVWACAVAAVPRRWVAAPARLFVLPERRRLLNPLLGMMGRRS
jgi:glycosyltransferase involved in cell wall biosynthesis